MDAVARHTAHVLSVVLAALPVENVAVFGVALEARCVGGHRRHFVRAPRGLAHLGAGTRLGVLLAVSVADRAIGGALVLQEFGAFAVKGEGEGFHHLAMTLPAVPPDHGLPGVLLRRLRQRSTSGTPREGMQKAEEGQDDQRRDYPCGR